MSVLSLVCCSQTALCLDKIITNAYKYGFLFSRGGEKAGFLVVCVSLGGVLFWLSCRAVTPEGVGEPRIAAFNKNQQQIITAFARGKLKPSPAWKTCTAQHLFSINISLLLNLCNPFRAQQL